MKNLLSISAIIISLSVGYYFVIYLPEAQTTQDNNAAMQELKKSQQAILACKTHIRVMY